MVAEINTEIFPKYECILYIKTHQQPTKPATKLNNFAPCEIYYFYDLGGRIEKWDEATIFIGSKNMGYINK